jgi:hypothetical protein
MKRKQFLMLPTLIFLLTSMICPAQKKEISISVDPRFELVSTVCRLADFDEYNMSSYPDYYKAVGENFAEFKDHRAVRLIKKLRVEHSIAYNAPMGFASYMESIDKLRPIVPMDHVPEDLDQRWTPEAIAEFAKALQEFVTDTDFKVFLKENEKRYEIAVKRFHEIVKEEDPVLWFNNYFGTDAENDFQLVLGLQNGGANYGARATDSQGYTTLYSVIGCRAQDEDGMPEFSKRTVSTVIHEFCHSYTNPIVSASKDLLEDSGRKMYERLGTTMSKMAYGGWEVMMYEYFVRACVVRYMHLEKGLEAAWKQAEGDIKRGFVGLDKFADKLMEYEVNRDKYPTFQDFVPELAPFFEQLASEINVLTEQEEKEEEAKWEKLKKEGPQLLKMTPANNNNQVSHDVQELKFYFDREMNPEGMAVMTSDDEKAKFPELAGTPYYDKENTVFIMKVKLEPNTLYKFSLNHPTTLGFEDTNGLGLYPVYVEFKTRK